MTGDPHFKRSRKIPKFQSGEFYLLQGDNRPTPSSQHVQCGGAAARPEASSAWREVSQMESVAWELSAHLWSWLGIQRPWGAQGLSADGPGLPTTDHAATLRGTSYTPGGPAFLTTQVSEASSLPLLFHEAALASCLAAGTNSPIEGRREKGFIQLTVQGCEPWRRQECEAAGHIHSHRQN